MHRRKLLLCCCMAFFMTCLCHKAITEAKPLLYKCRCNGILITHSLCRSVFHSNRASAATHLFIAVQDAKSDSAYATLLLPQGLSPPLRPHFRPLILLCRPLRRFFLPPLLSPPPLPSPLSPPLPSPPPPPPPPRPRRLPEHLQKAPTSFNPPASPVAPRHRTRVSSRLLHWWLSLLPDCS
ncbi:MAG: hypothetical protein BYD32DRAFT_412227 [Podila humilis]|nr:MAG: hypothetical protein BYD32DRAFT_412227 [Podila humilis]